MIRSKDVLFHVIDDCFRVTCHKPTTSLSHKRVIADTDLFPCIVTPITLGVKTVRKYCLCEINLIPVLVTTIIGISLYYYRY